LTPKEQDYLETIYLLARGAKSIGVSDIARARGVTLPTVFSVLTRLKENGMINQPHYGKIELHPEGEKAATEIYRVHNALRRFFEDILGLPPEEAEENACRLEHGISADALFRLEKFVEIVNLCRNKETGCLARFKLESCTDCDVDKDPEQTG
jgi:DtxR family Mn-dependent transcriptional regulator